MVSRHFYICNLYVYIRNFYTGSFSIPEWIMWWVFTGTANKHACLHQRAQEHWTRTGDGASTPWTFYITLYNKIWRLTSVLRSCLERWGWPNVVPDSSPAILKEKEWEYDQANAWPFLQIHVCHKFINCPIIVWCCMYAYR